MTNNKYHIDVTPEEDLLFRDAKTQKVKSPKNTMFGGVFWTVVGVHAVALGALATTSFATSSTKDEPTESSKQTTNAEPAQAATPAPTPAPTLKAAVKPTPAPTQLNKSSLTKTYTVKQGDTINSIAKRYKLRTERLLKLNNIKDSNKIVVGQTLKFF
jgi:LysM repeat protein